MGLFLKYKDYYKNETVVQSQPRTTVNNNGKQDYVAQTINTGVSIFGSLLSYTSDGKGGNDKVDNKKLDKTIQTLEKDLNKVLSNLGVSDVSQLDEYYKNKEIENNDEMCKMYEKYIEIYDNSTDYFSLQIKELETKKSKTKDKLELENINMQIIVFEKQKKEAKAKAEKIYNDTKVGIQKELQTIKLEIEYVKSVAKKIDALKNASEYTTVESDDINEQVIDYESFNEARLEFIKDPTQNNLEKLKKSYNEFDNIKANKSVTQAYNLLKNKYQTVEHDGKQVVLNWN